MSSSVPGSGSNFGNLASFLNSNREGSSRVSSAAAGRYEDAVLRLDNLFEEALRKGKSGSPDSDPILKDVKETRHGKAVLNNFVGCLGADLFSKDMIEERGYDGAPSEGGNLFASFLKLKGKLSEGIRDSDLLPQERGIVLDADLLGLIDQAEQDAKERCQGGELKAKRECIRRLFGIVGRAWKNMHLSCRKNRPKDEDIAQFQSAFSRLSKEGSTWREVMKRAGTLPKEGDINLIKFFLQCTQEEKSSSFGLLWWPGAGDDLKRLQGLFVETCNILEERAEIEASPAFKDFQSQLKTLGRKGESINSLKSLCRSAGISSDKMGLVCGFSDPGSGRFWKGKDEDSLNVALMALKEVIASRNRSQTKEVIVSSAEQQNVSISAPLAPASIVKEIASIEKRTTIHRDRFLNLCKRVVGLVGNIPGEELHGRVEDLVFKPRTGNKREFSESVNNYLNKKLAANMRASFSTFARAFFKAEAGDLYDDKIGDLVSSKHFASVKSLWSKK